MKTSVILTATDLSGKKLQKTLTNINSNATAAQLKTLAQGLNGLTTNTYVETGRVDKIVCDLETGKTTPTLTLATASATKAAVAAAEGAYENEITYNGDGVLTVLTSGAGIVATIEDDTLYVTFVGEGATGTVTVYASEGSEYAAANVTFTISAE